LGRLLSKHKEHSTNDATTPRSTSEKGQSSTMGREHWKWITRLVLSLFVLPGTTFATMINADDIIME